MVDLGSGATLSHVAGFIAGRPSVGMTRQPLYCKVLGSPG